MSINSELLAFIRGESHHWGSGLMTRPWLEEKRAIHEDCLELERAGLIYRYFETDKIIVWMPVEVD